MVDPVLPRDHPYPACAFGQPSGRLAARRAQSEAALMTQPLLSVRDLSVVFHLRRGDFTAVNSISFDIMPGEVLGVVGESGAGKSMTGTAIMGLVDRPGEVTAREILLKGERIDGLGEEAMRK